MEHLNVFTITVGSLRASLFVATRVQRTHGLKPFSVYIHYRQRVRLQWPARKNMAKPYDADLPGDEIMRTWSGLTNGDRGCDPNYKPTKTWAQIAADESLSPNARRYARAQTSRG